MKMPSEDDEALLLEINEDDGEKNLGVQTALYKTTIINEKQLRRCNLLVEKNNSI